jgi:hypothetical protein
MLRVFGARMEARRTSLKDVPDLSILLPRFSAWEAMPRETARDSLPYIDRISSRLS